MKTKLNVYGSNPDWCGSWTKSETEAEIRELTGREPADGEWLSWVFDHVFSDTDLDTEALIKVLGWSSGQIEVSSPEDGTTVTITLK